MTLYRKLRNSDREVYKIEGDVVMRVRVMEKMFVIDLSDNWVISQSLFDKDTTVECEREFFEERYKLALERITKGTI